VISRYIHRVTAAAVLLLAIHGSAQFQGAPETPVKPQPFVSSIFGDNMVLQRGKPNTIWGWSEPGDHVRVQIGNKTASGVAGVDHRWQVTIKPPAPGGPYTVRITGHESVELKNVLVGDVWLCGGQSNMQVSLRSARNGDEEIKAANYPQIRFFSVAPHSAYRHTDAVQGNWKVVSPGTAERVSAVAYYFARKIQDQIHVPIGLVVDAVGGTPAEAWTSAAALKPLHDFDIPLAELQRLADAGAPEYGNFVMHWYDDNDIGLKGNWAAPDFDDSSWKSVDIPGGFAELGVPETPAVAWFRKEIVLPDPLPPGRALLFLGSIERMDTAYINGASVGASAWVENPRVYPLFGAVLKPGKNVIAIRVLKTKPEGGFLGKPEELHLLLGDKTSIPLAGKWKGVLSVDLRPPHSLPLAYENWPVMPSVLYEGMLKPIAPLAITGALWYQGEQNSERGYQYRKILPAMIADWRELFGQGDFPFYIVSLPTFQHRSDAPVDAAWSETRESQALTAASVHNSCLAVTIDTGDPDNLHPKDKQPVGERLALCALAKNYHKKVVYSGPTLKSVDRLPGSIRLHFAHTDGGLVVTGSKLEEFSIAGEDRKWYWADAHIEGKTVVVSSPSVPNPKEVRYAWQSNPAATLFNGAGLPAGPFRTDTWPGITQSHRPY
jgi:sialate O-acetylesterase